MASHDAASAALEPPTHLRLSQLPVEVFLRVLDHLLERTGTGTSFPVSVLLVCKRWKEIAVPLAYREVVISTYRYDHGYWSAPPADHARSNAMHIRSLTLNLMTKSYEVTSRLLGIAAAADNMHTLSVNLLHGFSIPKRIAIANDFMRESLPRSVINLELVLVDNDDNVYDFTYSTKVMSQALDSIGYRLRHVRIKVQVDAIPLLLPADWPMTCSELQELIIRLVPCSMRLPSRTESPLPLHQRLHSEPAHIAEMVEIAVKALRHAFSIGRFPKLARCKILRSVIRTTGWFEPTPASAEAWLDHMDYFDVVHGIHYRFPLSRLAPRREDFWTQFYISKIRCDLSPSQFHAVPNASINSVEEHDACVQYVGKRAEILDLLEDLTWATTHFNARHYVGPTKEDITPSVLRVRQTADESLSKVRIRDELSSDMHMWLELQLISPGLNLKPQLKML